TPVGLRGRVHSLAFDPVDPSIVYAEADGLAYRSDDGGVSWTKASVGLRGTTLDAVAVTADGGSVVGGATGVGVVQAAVPTGIWHASNRGLHAAFVADLSVPPTA